MPGLPFEDAPLKTKRNKSLTSIQKRLGHSSIKVTSDLYGRLYPEVDGSIAVVVEEILEGAHLAGIIEQAREDEREQAIDGPDFAKNGNRS